MRKERKTLKTAAISANTGQLDWLPKNPRQWTADDLARTAQSIEEDTDFLEDRPLLVVPDGKRWIVFAGNLRHAAAKEMGLAEVPCVEYRPEDDDDRLTIKRRAMKDNGSFGSWDYDELANSWDDLPLPDFGIEIPGAEGALSSKGREMGEGYQDFVEKFDEELPLTTDDCYTPPEVYELVKKFVDDNLLPLKGREVIRPFFPGGDYENARYPDGCVVIDNPPFSLYSKIVRFYLSKGIHFFLFGPQLSLIVADADCCFCPFQVDITYENGAVASTGFATDLKPDTRIWIEHTLREAILKAQKKEPTKPVYNYPEEVISSALLGKIANGGDLEIPAKDCHYINNLDGMKEIGRGLFGGGFLLSQAAAEKARAAAEKARAAAEKARAIKIELSEREQAIVKSLG